MSALDKREENIIEAAIRVFSRYGVKRATMNDIASEAGVARQTLYNVYASKEDVLRGTIRWHAERSVAAIEAECAATDALGEQLDVVFKYLVVGPFELLSATPHADEILSGLTDAACEELDAAEKRYGAALQGLFAPHDKAIRAVGLTPAQFADLVQKTWGGFKHKVKNRRHLNELLASLKIVILHIADAE